MLSDQGNLIEVFLLISQNYENLKSRKRTGISGSFFYKDYPNHFVIFYLSQWIAYKNHSGVFNQYCPSIERWT